MTIRKPCAPYFDNAHKYHKVDDRLYEISDLRAVNIRDRIVRAALLARSLLIEGVIGPSKPLLVLGGGVAGVSCALAALNEGVEVWLIEKEMILFANQVNINSRRIDPVEFDWPMEHWADNELPHSARSEFPLLFKGGIAENVAAGWELATYQIEATYPDLFHVILGTELKRDSLISTEKGIEVDPKQGLLPIFGAAISCVGFGKEITGDVRDQANSERWNYVGERFWKNDRLRWEKLGIRDVSPVRILISGGGDGAMQDVLRTLTRRFGKELVQKLSMAPPSIATFSITFTKLAKICDAIDDTFWSQCSWDANTNLTKMQQEEWHKKYEGVIDEFWQQTKEDELDWQYSNVIREDVRTEQLQMNWLVANQNLLGCYSLNRILVSWITRLYARGSRKTLVQTASTSTFESLDEDSTIIFKGYEISKIQPSKQSHPCGERAQCTGKEHLVYVRRPQVPNDTHKILSTYHEIVIRHGVDTSATLWTKRAPDLNLRSIDIANHILKTV